MIKDEYDLIILKLVKLLNISIDNGDISKASEIVELLITLKRGVI